LRAQSCARRRVFGTTSSRFAFASIAISTWKVAGEPKTPLPQVAAEAKLDQEALERWVKLLAKPPARYPYFKKWQEMIQRGGTEVEAKRLADEFQELLVAILIEKKELQTKNEKLIAKGTPLEEVKSIPLPNDFKSFFDTHQIELRNMEPERMHLWTELFRVDLDSTPADGFKPGVFAFRGWGLERQVGGEWKDHLVSMRASIQAQRKALTQYPYVHGVTDHKESANLKIHLRGSPYQLGGETPRRFLEVLCPAEPKPFTQGSGRLELAEAIAGHPLATRVFVNRVWKWHFGSGIVDTPSNFGQGGERPVHPELLEHLTRWFLDNGMSLKKLHREIMLSAAYQLSGEPSAVETRKDPANRLHWRFSARRLEVEEIRDSLLSAGGALDSKTGGPSAELKDDFKRRTLYGRISRFQPDALLQLFDFPNPSNTAEHRFTTNVAPQRLYFLNSDFVYRQAEELAKRVAFEADDTARVRRGYRIAYQREPSAEETKAGLEFLESERKKPAEEDKKAEAGPPGEPAKPGAKKPNKPLDPLARYMRVLLSSNEFIYIE